MVASTDTLDHPADKYSQSVKFVIDELLVPQWNLYDVDAPFGVTEPLKVAEVVVMSEAAHVVTFGAAGCSSSAVIVIG